MNTVPKWWLPIVGALGAVGLATALLLIVELTHSKPPGSVEMPALSLGQRDGAIHVAGTGTWLPLAHTLASAYSTQHQREREERGDANLSHEIIVHDSIGTGGGLRAVEDGVIDVALVTHEIGHPPTSDCCQVVPIALAAVVFATHPSVTTTSLNTDEVVDIFSGTMEFWPDGQPLVPLMREQGDSSTRVARRVIEEFGEAIDEALLQRRWHTLLTDAEMGRALASTPGSVGLFDLGAIVLDQTSLKPLALEGVEANAETIADGRYLLRRTLTLVIPREPTARARPFLEFVHSARGLEVIRASGGYLPLEGGRP